MRLGMMLNAEPEPLVRKVDADVGVEADLDVGAYAVTGAENVFFTIANVICVGILAWVYLSVKL